MHELLRRFNGDRATREAIVAYLTAFIADEGVRRIFSKEDVSAVADAKILIDKAFEQLEADYGIKSGTREQTNEAR